MATPNVGILTNAGKDLIDRVNAGQTKITFTKIVFSSMDNSQLTDDKIRALTTVTPQEVVVNNPEVTLDNNTGETRIRATGTNEKLDDGVYVKTYGVFAKDDTGNEILYGLTVSPNPNYFPAYDGVTPQVVTYSYKVIISNTSNITFTNSNDVYLSENDLAESLKPYAKIVYVNQQLKKKVNVADMRKPASDVVGLDEIKGSILPNGTDLFTLYNTTGIPQYYYAVTNASTMLNSPDNRSFTIVSLPLSVSSPKYNATILVFRSMISKKVFYASIGTDGKGTNAINYGWTTNVIDNRDGTITLNGKTITPADDSKVVHNSGTEEIADQKTFDTAPIDKTTGNPYITKDGVPSLPPDLARTGKAQTFTAAQTFSIAPTITDASKDKGDNQAAVMADLKSLEKAAWHQLDVNISETNYKCTGLILYREINSSTLEVTGNVLPSSSSAATGNPPYIFPIFQLSEYSELSSTSLMLYVTGSEEGGASINVSFKGNTAYIDNGGQDIYNSTISGNLNFIVTRSMRMGATTVSFTK